MQFQHKRFTNGLTVLTAPLQGTEAVTVMVYVRVGSRYEQSSQQGVAHFLEHTVFKGTKKRPSSLHITKELDAIGADYNAFTTKNHTGYYVKAEYTHAEFAIELLADMLLDAQLPETELEKEKGVVIEEINMYDDQPSSLIEELFDEHIYGAKHPLGKCILGTHKTISNLTRTSVVDFYSQYYQTQNMIVSVSGKLPDNTEALIKKYFSKKTKRRIQRMKPITQYIPKSPVHILHKETKQAHLTFGFRLPLQYQHKDVNRLQLANLIFGGSMSSRLFTRVREKNGLGYYVYSHLGLYEDTSNWHIGVGVDIARLEKALTLLIKEWQRLQKGITARELADAKEQYKGKITLRTEDSSNIAQWYGKRALFGLEFKTPTELKAEIDSFTKDEINMLLQKYIKPKNFQLALVGPYASAEPFEQLLKKIA